MSTSDDVLPTAFNPRTCLRRGLCPVTSIQQRSASSVSAAAESLLESHSIYYEHHGKSDGDAVTGAKHKILFIMGLNSASFSWGPQVRYFGSGGEGGDCTALVFDNRGVGNSGYPRGPYTTSGMAEDVICLLDYVGWTGERSIHVVGISLGGMIAQELAYRIPQRICSLVLAVTTPGPRSGGFSWNNLTPRKGVLSLFKLSFTTDPLKKALIAVDMLFPSEWLEETAESDPHAVWPGNGNTLDNQEKKTNREVQKEGFLYRISVTKPQLFAGNLSQTFAALTHNVQPERLASIAANIPKIIIVTGDDDYLVHPSGSERIYRHMMASPTSSDLHSGRERVEFIRWQGTGHAIHSQREKLFNELVERCAREGGELIDGGWKGRD